MVWIGGVMSLRGGCDPELEILPKGYATERECAVALALLLHDMGLLCVKQEDDMRGWVVPDDWERACDGATDVRSKLLPSSRVMKRFLKSHVTSKRLLHWLCTELGECDYESDSTVTQWRFFLQAV